MQTREQVKNWKVVASVATVAALGVSGLAIASPGDPAETPPPIEIEDTRANSNVAFQTPEQPEFQIQPSPTIDLGDSLDSPLASADFDDVDGSPDTSDSPDVDDSPAPAPAVDDSVDSVDSPEPVPAPSVDDSVDSVDSPEPASAPTVDDSVDSVDSPEPAPAPAVDDSVDSVDSLDS